MAQTRGDRRTEQLDRKCGWRRRLTSDGSRTSSLASDPKAAQLVASKLPRWALIARWVSLKFADMSKLDSGPNLPTTALTDWFLVGEQKTFDVPIPRLVMPAPSTPPFAVRILAGALDKSEYYYDPLVALQYACNEYVDNSGWLHVYESWVW
jgi:hypothetical protein